MSAIALIITLGTIIFLLTASFVTLSFYLYRERLNAHLKEKEELKNIFQHEILRAQLEMQEQTFLTISQEIHDNIGQILSLIKLHISTIPPDDYPTAQRKIATSKELLDQVIEDLRNLSKRLNHKYVSQLSLAESLQFQLSLIQKIGIYTTAFEARGEEKFISAEVKLIIFRIAQEALNNVLKHAAAQTITVVLTYLPDTLTLTITDNGKGFKPQPDFEESELPLPAGSKREAAHGIGLYNMHYRAGLIGARFNIDSQPGAGTRVQLIIPLLRTLY